MATFVAIGTLDTKGAEYALTARPFKPLKPSHTA
jgi:hypothetical protein